MLRRLVSLSFLAMCVGAGASCAAESDTPDDDGPVSNYLPIVTDFQNFRSWQSFDLTTEPGPDPVHTMGPRRLYINKMPEPGATEFPIGTIIVKEIENGEIPTRWVFAMAKRVSDKSYNAKGATGWEWWEIENIDAEKVKKVWSGVGPPAGEKYGGDAGGSCNTCHVSGAGNDFVLSPALRLPK
jgi:hypothetical protein